MLRLPRYLPKKDGARDMLATVRVCGLVVAREAGAVNVVAVLGTELDRCCDTSWSHNRAWNEFYVNSSSKKLNNWHLGKKTPWRIENKKRIYREKRIH